ncbi:MAG TPA: glycoside hydrolase family 127 protein, partial [Verrucomicrobiota bacterium]|nr:glycoside hydrolase family 127 protein [Verrucomicrobiota bacterium]
NVEKIAGTDVEMVQKTDYPWSGNIAITVNPREPKRFSVHVRIPDRTTSALYTPTPDVKGLKSLAVNGTPVPPKIEKGYAVITREWKAGDRIELVLPMEPQRIKADERVVANRGRVAMRYGPLIYNVERADQSDIDKPLGKKPLVAEWRGDLLGGVMALKGEWADGSPMLAIPNYARMNRVGQVASAPDSAEEAVNYAPGSLTEASASATNAPAAGQRSGRGRGGRGRGGPSSIVWVRDL